jgi:hypothetical protein
MFDIEDSDLLENSLLSSIFGLVTIFCRMYLTSIFISLCLFPTVKFAVSVKEFCKMTENALPFVLRY